MTDAPASATRLTWHNLSSMGALRCVDGSLLNVIPVAARDRGGATYEVTLDLERNGAPFGTVGERCGYQLATLARRVAGARGGDSAQARSWDDPDDRFPDPPLEKALSRLAAQSRDQSLASLRQHLREPELFAFRHRDRGDAAGTGELRCTVRTSSVWFSRHTAPRPDGRVPRQRMSGQRSPEGALGRAGIPRRGAEPGGGSPHGEWQTVRRAVLEAWGTGGAGVRAVLTSSQLEGFLTDVLTEAGLAGADFRDLVPRYR